MRIFLVYIDAYGILHNMAFNSSGYRSLWFFCLLYASWAALNFFPAAVVYAADALQHHFSPQCHSQIYYFSVFGLDISYWVVCAESPSWFLIVIKYLYTNDRVRKNCDFLTKKICDFVDLNQFFKIFMIFSNWLMWTQCRMNC